MVLRKVKSAPANICEMVNRKKSNPTTINPRTINPTTINPTTIISLIEIDESKDKLSKFNLNKLDNIKNEKKSFEMVSDIINDLLLEDKNILSQEYFSINFIIPYIGKNIRNKNFIKNLYTYLTNYLIKSIIIYIFHQIHINNIEIINHYLHLDYFINYIK